MVSGYDEAFCICANAKVFSSYGSGWVAGAALEAGSHEAWQHESEAGILDSR